MLFLLRLDPYPNPSPVHPQKEVKILYYPVVQRSQKDRIAIELSCSPISAFPCDLLEAQNWRQKTGKRKVQPILKPAKAHHLHLLDIE